MTYSPINTQAYTAAFAGAIAGMAVSGWITNSNPSNYTNATIVAGAFAQAFDEEWNNNVSLNNLELATITSIIQTDFSNRGPGPLDNSQLQNVNNWTTAAAACVALVLESDTFFIGQGINPETTNFPNFKSNTDIALDTDAAHTFPPTIIRGLLPNKHYQVELLFSVIIYKDSDHTINGAVDFTIQGNISTNNSSVATLTLNTIPIPNISYLPIGLGGAKAAVTTSAGGFTISATRPSGIACHAAFSVSYSYPPKEVT